MSLSEQVAQLVVISAHGEAYSARSSEYRKYRHLVRDLHVGGLTINNTSEYGLVRHAEPHTLAVFLNQMQRLAKTPLLVSSDFERGASMRVNGAARFPYSMAYGAAGDIEGARFEGLTTAREARALGIQWVDRPTFGLDIAEHRQGADIKDGPGCGDECVSRHQYAVARANPRRDQSDVQG